MSRSLNKAMLVGNLGADPEVRTIGNGTKVAEFSVATGRQWTDKQGQKQEKTEWHRIVAWGFSPDKDGLAGVAERYLHKGDRVYVGGAIEYRTYEDKEGVTKYVTEIRAAELIMLGGQQERTPAAATAGKKSAGYEDFEAPAMDDDDSLPF